MTQKRQTFGRGLRDGIPVMLGYFAVSFALEHCGVTDVIAGEIAPEGGGAPNRFLLTPLIVAITAVGSAFVDNIVFVSTFIPIVKKIVAGAPEMSPLWWALLFGACYGGNITVVASTANIVASGLLEKHGYHPVKFGDWIKIGALVGVVSGVMAWVMLLVMPVPKPVSTHSDAQASQVEVQSAQPPPIQN